MGSSTVAPWNLKPNNGLQMDLCCESYSNIPGFCTLNTTTSAFPNLHTQNYFQVLISMLEKLLSLDKYWFVYLNFILTDLLRCSWRTNILYHIEYVSNLMTLNICKHQRHHRYSHVYRHIYARVLCIFLCPPPMIGTHLRRFRVPRMALALLAIGVSLNGRSPDWCAHYQGLTPSERHLPFLQLLSYCIWNTLIF